MSSKVLRSGGAWHGGTTEEATWLRRAGGGMCGVQPGTSVNWSRPPVSGESQGDRDPRDPIYGCLKVIWPHWGDRLERGPRRSTEVN